jgi:hypothetical protein
MYKTRSNVEAAIQTLQAKGQKITARSVRETIGGGSLEDIAKLISEILLGEPAADNAQALAGLPYDLPPLDQDVIQRHLRQMEGEQQALATIDHLETLVGACRAVQAVGEPGLNWLFRAVTQLGERSRLNMGISTLGEDLRQVSGTAAEMLVRMRREYQRVKGDTHEEGQDDAGGAASDREPIEGSDAGHA